MRWSLGPSMFLQVTLFHSFFDSVIFHRIDVPYLLNPLICWWTFGLFSCPRIMLLWTLACIYLFELRVFSRYMPRSGIAGSYWNSRSLHSALHSDYTSLLFHHSVKVFLFLHTLFSIYYFRLFKDGHSDWCEAIPPYGFDLPIT